MVDPIQWVCSLALHQLMSRVEMMISGEVGAYLLNGGKTLSGCGGVTLKPPLSIRAIVLNLWYSCYQWYVEENFLSITFTVKTAN